MAEIAFREAKDEALKCWFEAGAWLAKLYETSGRHDPPGELMKDLKRFTWKASEFDVKRGFSLHIKPGLTGNYAMMIATLLEGALEAYGYKVTGREVSSGSA
jgi:hypothetical protein